MSNLEEDFSPDRYVYEIGKGPKVRKPEPAASSPAQAAEDATSNNGNTEDARSTNQVVDKTLDAGVRPHMTIFFLHFHHDIAIATT